LEAPRLATTKLSEGLVIHPEDTIQSLQRKHRTDLHVTTKARKRTKNSGIPKIGVWTGRGLYGKEKLILEELQKANVDIAVIPETKKEIKGFAGVGRLYLIVQWCPNK
jgi:hypothetical protein